MTTPDSGLSLDDLLPGMKVNGVLSDPIEVIKCSWLGVEYLQLTYRDVTGAVAETLLDRKHEAGLTRAVGAAGEPFAGDAKKWKLALEGLRIRNAALLDDMLAVSASKLQPLPHQIKAVYGEFLPRTPLRYLLADDPGAGKTIMCGLYVKELILRGDLDRCLIVAPGALVEQWQDELWSKFGLKFQILSHDLATTAVGGSVFDENPLLIARMDMLSRNEDLKSKLGVTEWDLIVVDEAHRMSASWKSGEIDPTKRYNLGKLLSGITRNFLLMTATPHKGDPAAFNAFLALLDDDRFGAKSRDVGRRHVGTDVMRRMLKEELLTMEGRPLFPERRAATVSYRLSPDERLLYEMVSDYVRNEMNRVQELNSAGDRKRASTVGFALTVLQRRLASSPEAILRSLQRRRARLSARRDEVAPGGLVPLTDEAANVVIEAREWGETATLAEESAQETLVDAASAARTVAELETEIMVLDGLVEVAAEVRAMETDSKWTKLRALLEEDDLTRDDAGNPRKIIIFSEHRDTLRYLTERIRALPGRADGVVEIHGGLPHRERRKVQDSFAGEPGVSVLVATDAAGEGLNLQCAHLMVNYDLPWNPNRLDQRFGRIHRIGQTEVCHLWNLVAEGTREGDVFVRLLQKLAEQSIAYQGKVFDVLGEAFEGAPLNDLLVEAIRYGDRPDVRRRLETIIDARVAEGIPALVKQRALERELLQNVDVAAARERADLGDRVRLQPHFMRSWFEEALTQTGGRIAKGREVHRVTQVSEQVIAAGRRNGNVVTQRYEAVTFDPEAESRPGAPHVDLLGPGHALSDAVADTAVQQFRADLTEGTVLVDPRDGSTTPRLFAAVSHDVTDGQLKSVNLSRKFAFVEIQADGSGHRVGPSYLDYRPATSEERGRLLGNPLLHGNAAELVETWAMQDLVPEHIENVRSAHSTAIARTREDVQARLTTEIEHWKSVSAEGDDAPGARRGDRLESRLHTRLAELDAQERIVPRPPKVQAVALVIPAGLLGPAQHGDAVVAGQAVDSVTDRERALGRVPTLESSTETGAMVRSKQVDGHSMWVDVVVQPDESGKFFLPRTRVIQALNLGDRHRLALVDLSGTVRYVRSPFSRVRLDDFHQHQFEFSWALLWRSGEEPW